MFNFGVFPCFFERCCFFIKACLQKKHVSHLALCVKIKFLKNNSQFTSITAFSITLCLPFSHTHTIITFTLTLTWPLCGDHPRPLSPCHLSLPPVPLWCTHLLCHHHLLLVRVTTVCCPADAEQRTSPCPLYRPLYSHGTLLYSTHHCTEPRARAARAPCR